MALSKAKVYMLLSFFSEKIESIFVVSRQSKSTGTFFNHLYGHGAARWTDR